MTDVNHEPVINSLEITADRIIAMVLYNAEREDALDVPEFLAYEILELTDWMACNQELKEELIEIIILKNSLSKDTIKLLRKEYEAPSTFDE